MSDPMARFFCEPLQGILSYRCCLSRQQSELSPCSAECLKGKEIEEQFQGQDLGLKTKRGWKNPGKPKEEEKEEPKPEVKKRRGAYKGKSPYSPRFGYEYPRKS